MLCQGDLTEDALLLTSCRVLFRKCCSSKTQSSVHAATSPQLLLCPEVCLWSATMCTWEAVVLMGSLSCIVTEEAEAHRSVDLACKLAPHTDLALVLPLQLF